jgi:hypothetical protein
LIKPEEFYRVGFDDLGFLAHHKLGCDYAVILD